MLLHNRSTQERARWPDFFIVGAAKCGTSALAAWLSQHPSVFMPWTKEPTYFGRDIGRRFPVIQPTREQYLRLFQRARPDQMTGEASVLYLYSETAAEEIHDVRPDARIVVCIRDPVEMLASLHSHRLRMGSEGRTRLADVIADERRGHTTPRLYGRNRVPPISYYQSVSLSRHLDRYLKAFRREQVHIVVHDDLCAAPAAAYQRLCSHLRVDPRFQPKLEQVNRNRGIRNRFAWRLWFGLPAPVRSRIRAALPLESRAFRTLYLATKRLYHDAALTAPRPASLDPALAAELRRDFAPEVARLSNLVGRDLTRWTDPSSPEVQLVGDANTVDGA